MHLLSIGRILGTAYWHRNHTFSGSFIIRASYFNQYSQSQREPKSYKSWHRRGLQWSSGSLCRHHRHFHPNFLELHRYRFFSLSKKSLGVTNLIISRAVLFLLRRNFVSKNRISNQPFIASIEINFALSASIQLRTSSSEWPDGTRLLDFVIGKRLNETGLGLEALSQH